MNWISRRFACLIVVALAAIGSTARAADATFPAPLAKLELADGDCVVFLGDSITHQCLYTQYVEDYFYTRFPKLHVRFHNAGVGGAKAWDALERFDRDVAAYKPKYVTILLGMNDGSYQPFNQSVFDTYQKDMTELVGRLGAIGAKPILMTPTMYDARAARIANKNANSSTVALYNSVLAYYGAWLREVAVSSGDGFVDMYGPLNNLTLQQRKTNPNFTMIPDAVHPAAPGQLVMAMAVLTDMGVQPVVSNIRLVKTPKGQTAARATGGTLSDLMATDSGVEFTWLAESLPLVVPEEAAPGAKLLNLGHRVSREMLQVQALPVGAYDLSIDGEMVGTYQAAQLAQGVELEQDAKTPEYKQAAEVAELNRKRNAGPVHALRNEWSTFQQLHRMRAQLQGDSGNEKLAKQVADLEKKLDGMEDRIATQEKAAQEIEAQIFKVNQPQPRKYALKRAEKAK